MIHCPLICAQIVHATWVPCHWSSKASSSSFTKSYHHDTFHWRSGWVESIQVSMTQTLTLLVWLFVWSSSR